MRHIDRELAEAIKAAPGEEPGPDSKPGVARPAPPPRPKRNLGLLLGLAAVTGGVVALALSIGEGTSYAKTVDQLLADRVRLAGRPVNVQGTLVKGSLSYQDSPCEYRFTLTAAGALLPVRYPVCVVPDTFRDTPAGDVEVTASGKLAPDGSFEASNVMAKCPSREGYQPQGAAAAMPK
ncbi:MAG TPA: cytochrome c maturation protein CcmE [Polyangiaceae bacterium]|nr:cytochrome c maturation protein CcmE [Polyangiaceae bacterium]